MRLQADLRWVLGALARDEVLPDRYRDHALMGDWSDHRDCHIKPDLILIYRKPDAETLQLVRLGSHAELGLWARLAVGTELIGDSTVMPNDRTGSPRKR